MNTKKSGIIFGAKGTGRRLFDTLKKSGIEILYFTDNDKGQWGELIGGWK